MYHVRQIVCISFYVYTTPPGTKQKYMKAILVTIQYKRYRVSQKANQLQLSCLGAWGKFHVALQLCKLNRSQQEICISQWFSGYVVPFSAHLINIWGLLSDLSNIHNLPTMLLFSWGGLMAGIVDWQEQSPEGEFSQFAVLSVSRCTHAANVLTHPPTQMRISAGALWLTLTPSSLIKSSHCSPLLLPFLFHHVFPLSLLLS